ncbi:MAG: SPFH domain-containing protein [Candidatus Sericytochromatia bacterium]
MENNLASTLSWLTGVGWLLPLIGVLIFHKLILRIFGVVIIPQDSIGVVNKKFVIAGKNRTLPDGAIIALNGEAGNQADTLAPGVHFWLWPWQFEIERVKFVTVAEGFVGVVESRDGQPVSPGRVLGRKVECDSFQSARKFLENGGQRGPQIAIVAPGTYRINPKIFSVVEEPALEINDKEVGVVTTQDGAPLPTGEIAGGEITGHNSFQDGETFIANGGFKGLQEQVMLAGRYYVNPRFATVETKPMTEVPIAHVGVVIAYVGTTGVDVTGDGFKHGNLVSRGQKGVCAEPLDPGKYPINPYTHKLENVPTANVVLNWATGKSESHNLDKNLSTITVRSSDGFKFNLDVSQIIHIPRSDAPKVIARFGSVANLVTQVLEPTIGNYFRNTAQNSDVIEFLKHRSERQDQAKQAIEAALGEYNVGAVDTLIGDIVPPEELMKTLTDRKLAEQEKVTYETQRMAEETRKELEQARAIARTQALVVDSERKVSIAEFEAQAAVKTADGAAKSKTINAQADAEVTRVTGEAEAGKIKAVGTAEADVISLKITSMQSGNYAAIEVSKNLASSKVPIVPGIVAGGGEGAGGSGSSLVNVLLANLIQSGFTKTGQQPGNSDVATAAATAAANAVAEKMSKELASLGQSVRSMESALFEESPPKA